MSANIYIKSVTYLGNPKFIAINFKIFALSKF